MKKLFLPLMILVAVGTLSSCAKCYTCKNGTEKIKYCTSDEDISKDFDDIIEAAEDEGYKCTEGTGSI